MPDAQPALIYVDTSAVVKLLFAEVETESLRRWLAGRRRRWCRARYWRWSSLAP